MICKTLEMNYLKVLKNLLFVTFITQISHYGKLFYKWRIKPSINFPVLELFFKNCSSGEVGYFLFLFIY